jgi:anti-sigma-K factor RskA
VNYSANPELIERLAAEYVLGTLRGPARLRFARLAREQAAVRLAIAEWEARLSPMAEAVPGRAPPRRVWRNVAARVRPPSPAMPLASAEFGATQPARGFWDSLAFWRGWGLIATGCAAALVAAIALRPPQASVERVVQAPAQTYVATLKDKDGNVALVAVAGRNSDQLLLRRVALPDISPEQSYELWSLPRDKSGAPKPLGLIPGGDKGSIQLAALASQTLSDVPALAISLEPAGGSKTGLPTGPVLYSGPCLQFW